MPGRRSSHLFVAGCLSWGFIVSRLWDYPQIAARNAL
jgi:hypothetical protein